MVWFAVAMAVLQCITACTLIQYRLHAMTLHKPPLHWRRLSSLSSVVYLLPTPPTLAPGAPHKPKGVHTNQRQGGEAEPKPAGGGSSKKKPKMAGGRGQQLLQGPAVPNNKPTTNIGEGVSRPESLTRTGGRGFPRL